MTPEQLRLQGEIQTRLSYFTNDSRTLFKVRHDHREWYHRDHGDRPIGGGNFLAALGLLSALNFAAKVHLHLVEPEAFSTEVDQREVKAAIREVSKIEGLKAVVKGDNTKWISPRPGSCNEEKAFIKFAMAMKDKVDLGIGNTDEAREVWTSFRNALAHMVWPTGVVAVLRSENSSQEAEAILKAGPPVFWKEHYGWGFNVDRLTLEMDAISKWLCLRIEQCKDDSRIAAALRWMGKS